MINSNIRHLVEKNVYISEILKAGISYKYNKDMVNFINSISKIDSIKSIQDFEKGLKEIPSRIMNSYYTLKHSYAENTMYGYANELLNYAGLKTKDIFYLPLMEHGIAVDGYVRHDMNRACIFQGRYLEQYWKENSNGVPCYCIGPYIHYARDYYDNKQLLENRTKNGKTILIFPPHSTEKEKNEYTLNKFDDYLFNHLAKNYDTIIACVFWANLHDSYIESLASKGVKLVSAGFKLDPLFVQRLRTILSLADTVLYPAFTTSVGFAYYLRKKIIFINNNSEYKMGFGDDYSEKIKDLVAKGVESQNIIFSEHFAENEIPFNEKQEKLINYYWGVDCIKNPQQIREIVSENKKRIIRRFGF